MMEVAYEAAPARSGSSAQMVGDLEKLIYVYAVMGNHDSLMAGWLILKGFSSWFPQSEKQPIRRYHAYVVGNGYSLLVGLAFGIFAKHLAIILRQ
jgi:hypothetical protein